MRTKHNGARASAPNSGDPKALLHAEVPLTVTEAFFIEATVGPNALANRRAAPMRDK